MVNWMGRDFVSLQPTTLLSFSHFSPLASIVSLSTLLFLGAMPLIMHVVVVLSVILSFKMCGYKCLIVSRTIPALRLFTYCICTQLLCQINM